MRRLLLRAARDVTIAALGLMLTIGLLAGGLIVAPGFGLTEPVFAEQARRPPIVPPTVPNGAPEHFATWSYLVKVNDVWGRNWPLAIRWLEELNARYPGNPETVEKLYAAYFEDAREQLHLGDTLGARRRLQQAADLDPNRGEAFEMLDELDAAS